MKKTIATGAILLAITTIACASDPADPTQDDLNRINEQAGTNSAPVAKSEKKLITAGDWELGDKENLGAGVITPGTYIITIPELGTYCYWETVKNFDQTFDSIIANGNLDKGASARVVLKKAYGGLKLNGDCIATKKK